MTERMGMDLMSLAMGGSSLLLSMMQQQEQRQGPDIPTYVAVGVDFALAPAIITAGRSGLRGTRVCR